MRASSLHRVAHGKRALTGENGVASLNCCKIDCQCWERLVFPSHAATMLSVKSLCVFICNCIKKGRGYKNVTLKTIMNTTAEKTVNKITHHVPLLGK